MLVGQLGSDVALKLPTCALFLEHRQSNRAIAQYGGQREAAFVGLDASVLTGRLRELKLDARSRVSFATQQAEKSEGETSDAQTIRAHYVTR